MDDDSPDFTSLSVDTGDDGSTALDNQSNLSSDNLSDNTFSDLESLTAPTDVAPLDNVNGSSNIADPSSSLSSLFSNPTNSLIDALTGGAQTLGDELNGLIDPTQANTTASNSNNTLLLAGAGILLLILLIH